MPLDDGQWVLYQGKVRKVIGESRSFGSDDGYYTLETPRGKGETNVDIVDVCSLPSEGYLILWHEEVSL